MDGNLELPVTFCQEPIVTSLFHKMEPMVTNEQQEQLDAFARRLNQALDNIGVPSKGKNRQEIAGKMFGVTQKAARKWLEAINFPDAWRIPGMAIKLGVSACWLFFGDQDGKAASKPEFTAYEHAVINNLRFLETLNYPALKRYYVKIIDETMKSLDGVRKEVSQLSKSKLKRRELSAVQIELTDHMPQKVTPKKTTKKKGETEKGQK